MRSPTPAVRAALFGFVVVTLVAIAGAGLHLAAVDRDAEAAAGRTLQARAATVAAALAGEGRPDLSRALDPFGPSDVAGDLVLLDAGGRVYDTTDDDLTATVDWRRVASRAGGAVQTVPGRAADFSVATQAAWEGGPLVVAVRPLGAGGDEGAVVEALVAALVLGGLLAGLLVVMAWYAGPRTSSDLALLGERIAHGGGDRAALVRHGRRALGPLAEAFLPVAARLTTQDRETSGTREHVAALYQTNPHYVVLCSLDGKIVEANPAFYAATGLAVDAVRGGHIDALRETFPIEPLLEDGAAEPPRGELGVGHRVRDHQPRQRDAPGRGVAESVLARRRGPRRDPGHRPCPPADPGAPRGRLQRHARPHGGPARAAADGGPSQTLRAVLNAAGVVIASFDAGGATSRWNGGARALTGQPIVEVPHFAAVTAALGLEPAERAAFTQWFWSPSDSPFVARHGIETGRRGRACARSSGSASTPTSTGGATSARSSGWRSRCTSRSTP